MDESIMIEAIQLAHQREEKEQRVLSEIYILDNQVYFSRFELKGKEPDFTLVRNQDEMSTPKNYPKCKGF